MSEKEPPNVTETPAPTEGPKAPEAESEKKNKKDKKKGKGAAATAAASAAIPAGKAGAAAVKGTMALKIVSIAVGVAILFFLMIYGAGVLADAGGFSISFDKTASGDFSQISLSETEDFASPTVRLEVPPIEYMTNIDGRSIPAKIDGAAEGSHGTANYIAYTFFLRCEGSDCELKESFRIESSLRHAEEAIRVAVYRNGEQTTYAKVGTDGLPELNTTPFYGDVVFEETRPLAAEEVIRYTVVIWLEGNDPECRDDIKGGNVKMSLTFTVGEAAA